MLKCRIRVYQNPWSDTIGDQELIDIARLIAEKRAEHVAEQFAAGKYKRESLGLVLLDPTAPISRASSGTLLIAIAIGEDGERFVPNAIAKAMEHRDKSVTGGYGAYVDLTQSSDADFCYGFSTQVDGTIAAASAQSEIQDACEAGHAAVTLNYCVRQKRKEWREKNPDNRWFNSEDIPGVIYSRAYNQTPLVWDSGIDVCDEV